MIVTIKVNDSVFELEALASEDPDDVRPVPGIDVLQVLMNSAAQVGVVEGIGLETFVKAFVRAYEDANRRIVKPPRHDA